MYGEEIALTGLTCLFVFGFFYVLLSESYTAPKWLVLGTGGIALACVPVIGIGALLAIWGGV